METIAYGPQGQGFSRLKLFLALSRTPHGLLDLATPFLAALLQLGEMPSLRVAVLGVITAFSGYTAVYALNDLVDYKVDREDVLQGRESGISGDLDAVYVRHPMALGLLSYREGFVWAVSWAAAALAGAYLLNPVCAFVFVMGAILESVYCLMLKVSHLRVMVSGVVKTLGGVAAVFAVDPTPSPVFLVILFLWLFFWEVGGQNVPNDWTDLPEDLELNAETLPLRCGVDNASIIILGTLGLSILMSLLMAAASPARLGPVYIIGAMAVAANFLIVPALRLHRGKSRELASALFNRASLYPTAMLCVLLISWMF